MHFVTTAYEECKCLQILYGLFPKWRLARRALEGITACMYINHNLITKALDLVHTSNEQKNARSL